MEEFHNLWKCLRHVLQIFVEFYKSKKLGVPHIVASNGGNVLNVLTENRSDYFCHVNGRTPHFNGRIQGCVHK